MYEKENIRLMMVTYQLHVPIFRKTVAQDKVDRVRSRLHSPPYSESCVSDCSGQLECPKVKHAIPAQERMGKSDDCEWRI